MKIKDIVQYMSPNQEIIVWSDRFVETMFSGTVSELSERTKEYEVTLIEGSFMPNVIRLIV